MSDQNIVTDWKGFFATMPPGKPYDTTQHPPSTACSIVFGSESPLSYVYLVEGGDLLDRARDEWESNGGPQMWVTAGIGSAPWYIAARPSPVNTKGKKGKIGS